MAMKKWLLLVWALLLAGCAPADMPHELPSYEYVIGVSQGNMLEPWCIALHEEMQAHSQRYSNVRLVFTDAAKDTHRQREDIHRLVELGVDLLIISPNSPDDLQGDIAEIYASIPVIVMDQKVMGDQYTLFIGSNNRLVGNMAGNLVAELMPAGGGAVLELTGTADSSPARLISQGFQEVIAEHPEIELVDSIDGDWLRDTAEQRMKDFLIQSKPVDVVFAHNDAMAYGAYMAAQSFRVQDLLYVGVDGLESEGKRLVEQGVLAGSFFRHTGGKEAVDYAMRILAGEENLPKEITLDPYPIVPSELAETTEWESTFSSFSFRF